MEKSRLEDIVNDLLLFNKRKFTRTELQLLLEKHEFHIHGDLSKALSGLVSAASSITPPEKKSSPKVMQHTKRFMDKVKEAINFVEGEFFEVTLNIKIQFKNFTQESSDQVLLDTFRSCNGQIEKNHIYKKLLHIDQGLVFIFLYNKHQDRFEAFLKQKFDLTMKTAERCMKFTFIAYLYPPLIVCDASMTDILKEFKIVELEKFKNSLSEEITFKTDTQIKCIAPIPELCSLF